LVPRILSRIVDLPWSTWPSTETIGCLTAMTSKEEMRYMNLTVARFVVI